MSKQPTKIYGIFSWRETPDSPRPVLFGYVEDSFSMSWNVGRVRVWRGRDGPAIFQADFVKTGRVKKETIFLARLNSKMSPVDIVDWHPKHRDTKKYDWRNAKFALKKLAVT